MPVGGRSRNCKVPEKIIVSFDDKIISKFEFKL
jgi:hypothetical protein